ncbi:MAG: protein-disulfide reductase DsbD domain-containing protein [Pseudomonadota bacterium]
MTVSTAGAQSIVSTGQSFLDASLLAGAMAGGERIAGLEFVMAPGWKTYWRAPGEAGVPPRFDWSGSQNLAEIEVLWPAPELFESFGMTTIGYGDRVVLPVRLVPQNPAEPIQVSVAMELGVCLDICVFENTTIEATYAPSDTSSVAVIEAALSAVPPSGAAAGVTHAECRIEGTGRDRQFTASLEVSSPLINPYVVIEGTEDSWFYDTDVTQNGSQIAVQAALGLASEDQWVTREDIRITLLASNRAVDIQGCAAMPG